jgi:hypothetical protein
VVVLSCLCGHYKRRHDHSIHIALISWGVYLYVLVWFQLEKWTFWTVISLTSEACLIKRSRSNTEKLFKVLWMSLFFVTVAVFEHSLSATEKSSTLDRRCIMITFNSSYCLRCVDAHDISVNGSNPVFRWLVLILTDICFVIFVLEISV